MNLKKIPKKTALMICVCITISVMLFEFILSQITNSLMLFSDGLHMLGHGVALGVSFLAIIYAERKGSNKVEYIAALFNGITLTAFTVFILIEGIENMMDPSGILVSETIVVAVIGLIVNLITAWILFASGVEDLNTKSAFLHMLADTFSSVAIIAGAVVINYTDFFIIDALTSMLIAVVVGKWALGLIRDSSRALNKAKAINQ